MEIFIARFDTSRRLVSHDLDTGANVEIDRAGLPRESSVTRGFYTVAERDVAGVYASARGPMFFRGADRCHLGSPDVDVEARTEAGASRFRILERGETWCEIHYTPPETNADFFAWLANGMRDRERFIAHFTTQDDLFVAAARAAELDPDSPRRHVLPPTTGSSAAWRGLSKITRARTIAARHVERGSRAFDLGQGVIAYQGRAREDGIVGVDILACRPLWTSRDDSRVSDEVSDLVLHRDPRTGARTRKRPVRVPGTACMIGDHTAVIVGKTESSNLNWGNEDPSDFEVFFHDVESGRKTRVLEHSGDLLRVRAVGENALVHADSDLHMLDRRGRVLWSEKASRDLAGVVDGRIFVGHSPVTILDASTGRSLAVVNDGSYGVSVFVTDEIIALSSQHRVIGLSRHSLTVEWERTVTGTMVAATADALLLLVLDDPNARFPTVRDVVSLSPISGETTSSMRIAEHGCAPVGLCAAGKLVLLSFTGGPPVVVID